MINRAKYSKEYVQKRVDAIKNKNNFDQIIDQLFVGRPSTIKTQKSLFNNNIRPYLIRVPEPVLNADFLDYLVKCWREWDDLKPATIKMLIGLFNRYVEYETGEKIKYRRARSVTETPTVKVKSWTKEEMSKALLTAKTQNADLHLVMALALFTGMRKGEVFGLQWDDVDFIQGTITITRSYDGPTKTGRARSVPIHDYLEKLLLDRFVPGVNGPILNKFDPSCGLKKVCYNADVKEITFHGLRHTFATLGLEAGCSPRLMAATLGHTKVSTTLDIYWNLTKDKLDLSFLPKEL